MFVYVLHLKIFGTYIYFFSLVGGGEWVSLYGSLIRSSNSLVLIGAYYAWEVENR